KTETIVKRYGQTRRPHPGFNPEKDKTLEEAIEREKNRLFPLREISNLVIDTTERNVHDLRREIKSFAESVASGIKRPLRINFLSFGFKHGVPIDCDLVVDVRFLPNPFFVEGLSNKTGHETEVIEYVMRNQAAGEFVTRYLDMLAYLIPLYANSGKPYLNIGVGCTGGRHRSVVLAEALASEMLKKAGERQHFVSVKHRDLDKPQ
ncbi:MAG: hypothetical protein DCC75_04175, partial [Proteobacteria bacterium]